MLQQDITFDSYTDRVRDADLLFLKTGPSLSDWGVEAYQLGRLSLQFGDDGGPRIVHGIMRSDAFGFIIQRVPNRHVLFDGQILQWTYLATLRPGSHFVFSSPLPTRWVSLVLSLSLLEEQGWNAALSCSTLSGNPAFRLTERSARQLVDTATNMLPVLRTNAADPAPLKKELLDSIGAALFDADTAQLEHEKYHQSRISGMSRILEYVRSKSSEPIRVSEIAEMVGHDRRSLQRLFKTYLDITPKAYLQFRVLNLVRRSLRYAPKDSSVTQTLIAHGVTEFGRFGAEYKSLFGELPSETLRRARDQWRSKLSGPLVAIVLMAVFQIEHSAFDAWSSLFELL